MKVGELITALNSASDKSEVFISIKVDGDNGAIIERCVDIDIIAVEYYPESKSEFVSLVANQPKGIYVCAS